MLDGSQTAEVSRSYPRRRKGGVRPRYERLPQDPHARADHGVRLAVHGRADRGSYAGGSRLVCGTARCRKNLAYALDGLAQLADAWAPAGSEYLVRLNGDDA